MLLSIQALLSAPNPDDPLATDVAKHYKENEKDAQRVSQEWTQKYAAREWYHLYVDAGRGNICIIFSAIWTELKGDKIYKVVEAVPSIFRQDQSSPR